MFKKFLITSLFGFTTLLSANAMNNINPQTFQIMKEEITKFNKKMPISQEKGMSLRNVSLSDSGVITYKVLIDPKFIEKEVGKDFDKLELSELKKRVIPVYMNYQIRNICSNSQTRNVLKMGFSFRYNYFFGNSKKLGSTYINAKMCKVK